MMGVALVIGASRGIGRQVAVDLAKNGYAGMEVTPNLKYSVSPYLVISGRRCKKYLRCCGREAISARS
jgi:hypothetical protein